LIEVIDGRSLRLLVSRSPKKIESGGGTQFQIVWHPIWIKLKPWSYAIERVHFPTFLVIEEVYLFFYLAYSPSKIHKKFLKITF